MATSHELKMLIEHMLDGTATDVEQSAFLQAVRSGQIRLEEQREAALPTRGATIGRNLSDSVVITGDGNVVQVVGSAAGVLRDVLTSRSGMGGGNLPPLPELFIGREQDLAKVRQLLTTEPPASRPGVPQRVLAIRGWPGVGKTTLAATLAYDAELRSHFPDGVLWTSLGEKPAVLSLLVAWCRQLGHESIGPSESIQAVSARLAYLLRDRRMLLVVDDVWRKEDALPFRAGGVACGMVITTREHEIARSIASAYPGIEVLEELRGTAALDLLKVIAPEVVEHHPQDCLQLTRRLEGLPLALRVAGRLLAAEAELGWGVRELLDELKGGVRLLNEEAPLDRADPLQGATPTIAALLRKSTDRLDPQTRERFAFLSVFRPPATFALDALKAVWQVANPRPTVRILVDRGLLEPLQNERFQLHALLVHHAASLLTD